MSLFGAIITLSIFFAPTADIDQREVISRWVDYLEMVADTGKIQQGRRVFRRLRQIRRTHEQFDARQNRPVAERFFLQ
ncbi:Uncharacterised protein [Salmonella enterica subsp. enterica]|uniref:Uncharacterized protein n=1 Tax=Salmonella enterica I TaxID=59201 RepID=A0A3S4M0P3_SALET|nr:Uncharacterised protein [Salmonella enterica subsp. enterica]